MATAQSKLDILIEARNSASGTLRQVQSDASGLENALVGIGTGLVAAFSIEAIRRVADASFELARMSAQTTDIKASFDQLGASVGQSSVAMMSSLKEASRGAISDYDLMLNANRAMMSGVADSAEEIAALMDVARARSQAVGATTADAFQDIVTGIARGSTQILDNLNIFLDLTTVYEEYASGISKTVAQLSDQEKKQALVNAVLRDSADLVKANEAAGNDAASNFERMDAAISNAKDALGGLFQPAMVVVANSIADAAQAAADSMNEMAHIDSTNTLWAKGDDITRTLEAMEAAAQRMREAGGSGDVAGLKEAANHIEMLRASLQAMGEQYNVAAAQTGAPLIDLAMLQQGNMAFQEMSVGLNNIEAAADGASAALGMMNTLAQEAWDIAVAQSLAITQQIESAAAASGALFAGKQGGDAGLARQQAVTAELTAQRKLWLDLNYTTKEIDEVLMPGYISQLREADQSLFRAASNTTVLSDEARAAKAEFESLKGTIEGVLQGALNTGVASADSILESMGLRPDAINEDARRLADVAIKGFDSPWADYFRTAHPGLFDDMFFGDIKAVAAQQLKDFEDGLNPELIDRDRAKERIKRMIIGDQSMAAMASELAAELSSELGVPMQQALQAAQGELGMGGGMLGVGGESAQGFTDGAVMKLDETGGGAAFVDRYVGQMRGNFSVLGTAGRDAAKVWSDGFYGYAAENLSPALISLLAQLVTPSVMAQFAQQGSLEGAVP